MCRHIGLLFDKRPDTISNFIGFKNIRLCLPNVIGFVADLFFISFRSTDSKISRFAAEVAGNGKEMVADSEESEYVLAGARMNTFD